VQKTIKAKHAIFFQLSNLTLDSCFFDKTSVLFDFPRRRLLFFSPLGARSFSFEALSEAEEAIRNRVQYSFAALANHSVNTCSSISDLQQLICF